MHAHEPRAHAAVSLAVGSDYKSPGEHPLPHGAWQSIFDAVNVSFNAHIDADVYDTVHHMIGADVRPPYIPVTCACACACACI